MYNFVANKTDYNQKIRDSGHKTVYLLYKCVLVTVRETNNYFKSYIKS